MTDDRAMARVQRSYDHRLRNLVRDTGDVTIATRLGVLRSAAAKEKKMKVYEEEVDHELVRASRDPREWFRVSLVVVRWDQSQPGRRALVVFRQYAAENQEPVEDWEAAKRRREIVFTRPANIEFEDAPRVLTSATQLIQRNM